MCVCSCVLGRVGTERGRERKTERERQREREEGEGNVHTPMHALIDCDFQGICSLIHCMYCTKLYIIIPYHSNRYRSCSDILFSPYCYWYFVSFFFLLSLTNGMSTSLIFLKEIVYSFIDLFGSFVSRVLIFTLIFISKS